MTTSIRVRKNLLGTTQPESVKKEVCDLLQDSNYDKIVMRPVYQRHIRWSPSAMNDFISTIMDNGFVPGIIMYKFDSVEKASHEGKKLYEMVDGQHRVFTLKAFMNSDYIILPHIKKEFIVHWLYKNVLDDGTIEYSRVFYKETEQVIEYCQKNHWTPSYLTEDERDHFERFSINISIIQNKLTLDMRREIFMSLQKGIPVRSSDLLKNKTDCALISFISENNYEKMMIDTFIEHCYKKANNYWIHWVCRCFMLYKHFHIICKEAKLNERPVSEIFLLEDKQIKKLIEMNSPELNPRNEREISYIHDFDDVFRDFISFLQKIDNDCWNCLNPTQIFALFYVLCDETKNREVILTHIPYLSREGQSKTKKLLWESRDEREPRRVYFNKCYKDISEITEPALPLDDRQITKSLRKQVWNKCKDNLCKICEDEITEKDFEAGHIIPRVLSGQTVIDNLIPICFSCNRSMGTRNAYEYKRDVYPHTVDPFEEEEQKEEHLTREDN